MSSDDPVFRVGVELTNQSVRTFDDIPAAAAQEAVRMFTENDGDGLRFVRNADLGVFFWPWDEIAGVWVQAMERKEV